MKHLSPRFSLSIINYLSFLDYKENTSSLALYIQISDFSCFDDKHRAMRQRQVRLILGA